MKSVLYFKPFKGYQQMNKVSLCEYKDCEYTDDVNKLGEVNFKMDYLKKTFCFNSLPIILQHLSIVLIL